MCPNASEMMEAGCRYVYLPQLKVNVGDQVKVLDALMVLGEHSGYPTRLFLSALISERSSIRGQAANWTQHFILGRQWWSWSWKGVQSDLPWMQILLGHLEALR